MIDVAVVGIAGSGTRWLTRLIRAHPDVSPKRSHHHSFPTGTGKRCKFPNVPMSGRTVFVICRDESIMKVVWERHGMTKEESPLYNYDLVKKTLLGQVEAYQGPKVFVSYETLLSFGWIYFETILLSGGLDPARFDRSKFKPEDGNGKYVFPNDPMGVPIEPANAYESL